MYTQRIEDSKHYKESGRNDLAINEEAEAKYISEFLPKEVSEKDLKEYIYAIINEEYNNNITMRDMKAILIKVQNKYVGASGKVVSNIIKNYIKSKENGSN